MKLYGNMFGGVQWVIPFEVQVIHPFQSEYADFGWRPPITSLGQTEQKFHYGLDLNPKEWIAEDACYVIATRAGKVQSTGFDSSAGNYVYIDHEDGYKSHYFHLKDKTTLVKAGDKVAQGQRIAIRGTTGSSTGLHLHFGITKDGDIPSELRDNCASRNNTTYVDPEIILFGARGAAGISNKEIICSPDITELSTDKGKIWTFLTSKFNACAAAGIMGNIECESNFSPNNLQGSFETDLGYTDESYTEAVDNGTYRYSSYSDARSSFAHDSAGYGLIQWTWYTLKEALYDSAKEQNVSIADLDFQCNEIYKAMDIKMLYSADIYPDGYDSSNWTKEETLIQELKSSSFVSLSAENPDAAVKYATALFLFECERCADYENKIDVRFERSKPIYDTFKELGCSHEKTRRNNIVVPTCTEEGYSGDEVCTTCGVELSKGEKISARGHEWDYSYGGEVCRVCSYVSRYPIGGSTPYTSKLKQVHNVLRDILVRKNNT